MHHKLSDQTDTASSLVAFSAQAKAGDAFVFRNSIARMICLLNALMLADIGPARRVARGGEAFDLEVLDVENWLRRA